MAIYTGVIILENKDLVYTKPSCRLEIEDNIGEGIHIHYKNFRLDYTIEEFLNFSNACEEALASIK